MHMTFSLNALSMELIFKSFRIGSHIFPKDLSRLPLILFQTDVHMIIDHECLYAFMALFILILKTFPARSTTTLMQN